MTDIHAFRGSVCSTNADRILEEEIHRAFERIERDTRNDFAPSVVQQYLDQYWDLGDFWFEWYTADGIEESDWR